MTTVKLTKFLECILEYTKILLATELPPAQKFIGMPRRDYRQGIIKYKVQAIYLISHENPSVVSNIFGRHK
jgi:hypothetical protein